MMIFHSYVSLPEGSGSPQNRQDLHAHPGPGPGNGRAPRIQGRRSSGAWAIAGPSKFRDSLGFRGFLHFFGGEGGFGG